MTSTPALTQTPQSPACQLWSGIGASVITGSTSAAATVSNTVLFATAGANGSILKSMRAASMDSAAINLQIWIDPAGSGTKYLLGTIHIGALAGDGAAGATVNVDLFANATPFIGLSYDNSGKPCLLLSASTKIWVGSIAALTASKHCWITGEQEDF